MQYDLLVQYDLVQYDLVQYDLVQYDRREAVLLFERRSIARSRSSSVDRPTYLSICEIQIAFGAHKADFEVSGGEKDFRFYS